VDAIVDRLAKPFAELGGRLDGVAGRFEGVAGRMGGIDDLDHHLDKQDSRLDGMPSTVHGPVRERLDGGIATRLAELGSSLGDRPDAEALSSLVRSANRESELRHEAQLDEAMATFAELTLGAGGSTAAQPAPRPAPRRTRKAAPKASETTEDETEQAGQP